MLYDLNVPWSSTQSSLELQRIISFLSELGYDTLALNNTITLPLPSQITNPIPTTPSFNLPPKTNLLRRCTVQFSDPALNHRLSNLASAYDILALRPTTEKAFLAACTTVTEHSLISLDLTQRFDFAFRPKPFMAAVNRGIRFEICYAQATMREAGARKNFISGSLGILRATSGRGLVVSSEAKGVLGIRAPADVVNLMAVWGLKREKGLEALGINPRGVVVNEGIKRSSFRGVIDVIDGGEKYVKDAGSEKDGKGKKGKRKVDDKEVDGEIIPQISKRQAKRLKLEARKEAQNSTPGQDRALVHGIPGTPNPDTPSKTKNKADG
ncbi:hypothetical protein B7494_g1526 [Chlorociboria aeruginascens]|nr:hypothetical protein B7494_g1526 [Chlorociboria aeruginascens]